MTPKPVIVTGASGQDGYFLTQQLLSEGRTVYAVTRRPQELAPLTNDRLHVLRINMLDGPAVIDLVAHVQAEEIYNLAGISSVAASFSNPRLTWSTNVDAVVTLLDAVRLHSLHSRVYQASSSEMFGFVPNESVVHDEYSPLRPGSPYAAAKAATHLLCQSYRESFGIKVACGILFNHESHRRPEGFLTRKIADHAQNLIGLDAHEIENVPVLELGNLKARRDWGFAPDYVDGIIRVMRQVEIRSNRFQLEDDYAGSYRDYVLGSGETRAVWELVDAAFSLVGVHLAWNLDGNDPLYWTAHIKQTGTLAVKVNPNFLRPNDPAAIQADPARALYELGWEPRNGIREFMADMIFGTRSDS